MPAEVLSQTPPPGVRPFAYVNQQPSPETPAGLGGLNAGDALLSLGDAVHLRDVQTVLMTNIGRLVPVICVDSSGRHLRKHIIPHAWDSSSPKSLLGCQMSNQCPARHPAVLAGQLPPGKSAARPTPNSSQSHHEGVAPHRAWSSPPSSTTRAQELQADVATKKRQESRSGRASSSSCLPHVCLVTLSLLHLLLVIAIVGLPTISPGQSSIVVSLILFEYSNIYIGSKSSFLLRIVLVPRGRTKLSLLPCVLQMSL